MQYITLILATAASFASAQSSVGTPVSSSSSTAIGAVVPVGGNCTPGITQCALGSNCYATNSMLQPRCGNFQASCTSDQQCAFNTCNLQQGLCNGFLATSSSMASATTVSTSSAGQYSPAPSSTVTAPAGSLPLGAECNASVSPSQCTSGVQCWASNAGLIARCGNFNAICSSNAQCAYNTCNNGLCNGFLASSSATASSAKGNATTIRPTGSYEPTGTATSTSVVQYTGVASVANVASGALAVLLGSVAWAL